MKRWYARDWTEYETVKDNDAKAGDVKEGTELFLLYQRLVGRRVPSVITGDLILQLQPLLIASRKLRELCQLFHDIIHLCLDLFGQIAVDVFAIDLLQCVGQVTQLLLYHGVS